MIRQMNVGLYLKKKHYEIMLNDVKSRAPAEACGLIAGLDSSSEKIYVITNILDSPVRFKMDPKEHLKAFNDIDSHDYKLLAIFHSHPNGPIGPSETDMAEFAYPETLYLVWSRQYEEWFCRSYKISNQDIVEVPLHILENE